MQTGIYNIKNWSKGLGDKHLAACIWSIGILSIPEIICLKAKGQQLALWAKIKEKTLPLPTSWVIPNAITTEETAIGNIARIFRKRVPLLTEIYFTKQE